MKEPATVAPLRHARLQSRLRRPSAWAGHCARQPRPPGRGVTPKPAALEHDDQIAAGHRAALRRRPSCGGGGSLPSGPARLSRRAVGPHTAAGAHDGERVAARAAPAAGRADRAAAAASPCAARDGPPTQTHPSRHSPANITPPAASARRMAGWSNRHRSGAGTGHDARHSCAAAFQPRQLLAGESHQTLRPEPAPRRPPPTAQTHAQRQHRTPAPPRRASRAASPADHPRPDRRGLHHPEGTSLVLRSTT